MVLARYTKPIFLLGKRILSSASMPTLANFRVLADTTTIEKPLLDDRSYRLIKLQNDLHALVIHDPTTDKSAASLDVNVGAFADRKYEVSGLAHFCEHLLFMGTKKYPEENEYSSYLAKHSGHSNAYTAAEHTNYYFEVGSGHFLGALDRFAQFFIAPLFSKSCKDREIRAVDSENKKNLQNDMWRLYQLEKLTSNPSHPYSGFSTGNFHTLHEEPIAQGKNVRDVLIDFHLNQYSSNLMSLVVLGKEDLDTLSTWVSDLYSDIPNKSLSRPDYEGSVIFAPEQLGKLVQAKPIMDSNKLELNFMIPDDQEEYWESKPSGYFSHLLGHESSGSLLHYLKEKSWVNELSAGNMKVCQGSSLFIIEFELTPAGLDHWQDIVVNVFEYISMVTTQEPQKWLWEEIKLMSEIDFKFRQKKGAASTVSKMSSSLYKFWDNSFIPPTHLLSSSINRKFDPEAITKFGSYLFPENARITLISKKLEGLDMKEKWYGTDYSLSTIDSSLLERAKLAAKNDRFHFPRPNPFIPKNFDVANKKLEKPLKHPFLISDTSKFQVWFKQDDQFLVPKGTIEILLHLPDTNTDCKSSVFSMLMAELVADELTDIVYYASLVGMSFKLSHWRDGLLVKVSGYNDKLPVLLETVLSKIKSFVPKKDRFETLKYKMIQDLTNFGYNVPYIQIGTHMSVIMNDKTYTHEDRVKVLQNNVDFEGFGLFCSKVWELGLFGEALIQGNFSYEKACGISSSIDSEFRNVRAIGASKNDIDNVVRLQSHILQPGETVRVEMDLMDEKNVNSCIEYYIQIENSLSDIRKRTLTDLLETIMHEPCFNQLRTKEQLGYVVFSGVRLSRTAIGFRILIQSERLTSYLEYRIEEFLKRFSVYVNELTAEQFDGFKQALKDKKLTKLKNLSEEVSRFWEAIADGYYDFEAKAKHAGELENITQEEFVEFFKSLIHPESKLASRAVLHLKSQRVPPVAKAKLVQCALNNFLYSEGIQVESEKIEELLEGESDTSKIADKVLKYLAENSLVQTQNAVLGKLALVLEKAVDEPQPSMYPRGELQTLQKYRSSHPLGGLPTPVAPLKEFYYPSSEHL